MLWSSPYATGNPKCVLGAKCMTQIFLSYSSDLNCTLLVPLQNQTCDRLTQKLSCSVPEEARAKVALCSQHAFATGTTARPRSPSWGLGDTRGVRVSLRRAGLPTPIRYRGSILLGTAPSPPRSVGEERPTFPLLHRCPSIPSSRGASRLTRPGAASPRGRGRSGALIPAVPVGGGAPGEAPRPQPRRAGGGRAPGEAPRPGPEASHTPSPPGTLPSGGTSPALPPRGPATRPVAARGPQRARPAAATRHPPLPGTRPPPPCLAPAAPRRLGPPPPPRGLPGRGGRPGGWQSARPDRALGCRPPWAALRLSPLRSRAGGCPLSSSPARPRSARGGQSRQRGALSAGRAWGRGRLAPVNNPAPT